MLIQRIIVEKERKGKSIKREIQRERATYKH